MRQRWMKLALVVMVPVGVLLSAVQTNAYPPFLAKAEKYGAKDCTFCHTSAGGGSNWNARGKWLMAEKKRRGVDQVDVDWLAKYKGK